MANEPDAGRRVYLIDDLLGVILLFGVTMLLIALDLTRRHIWAVHELAFVLFAACSFLIIGGLVGHNLSDDQLQLALYTSYLNRKIMMSYVYLPLLASLAVTAVFVLSLVTCSCECCCLVGCKASSHYRCLVTRLRTNGWLYAACLAWLLLSFGVRLNARLRESVINPVGGTIHWILLRSPFFLTLAHVSSLLLVSLRLFLQHVDKPSQPMRLDTPDLLESAMHPASVCSSPPSAAIIEELIRPPERNKLLFAHPAEKSVQARHPEPPQMLRMHKPTRIQTQHRERMSGIDNQPVNDGDVSSQISSDSDSDDEVLKPKFDMPRSSALPPRPTRSAQSHMSRRPSSISLPSGYSSSPPASPTRSSESTTSLTSNRKHHIPPRTVRSRPSSSSSSTSTTALSHTEDRSAFAFERPRMEMELRRRPVVPSMYVASTNLLVGEWTECVDHAVGSAYYYNTRTGESRWK